MLWAHIAKNALYFVAYVDTCEVENTPNATRTRIYPLGEGGSIQLSYRGGTCMQVYNYGLNLIDLG